MTKVKKTMKILLAIAIITFILLPAIYINHKIHLNREQKLLLPVSTMVEIDGHNMSVYILREAAKKHLYLCLAVEPVLLYWISNLFTLY